MSQPGTYKLLEKLCQEDLTKKNLLHCKYRYDCTWCDIIIETKRALIKQQCPYCSNNLTIIYREVEERDSLLSSHKIVTKYNIRAHRIIGSETIYK